ncbi:MAG: phosphoglycerate dehydrogenase [Opitutales bacterium]|nr:phosphoglycerate dehydrogenase [Opitutales bacterium]
MKILVADPISPVGVERLKACEGFDVVEAYGSSPEQILALAADAAAIIVRSETKVKSEVIAAANNLQVVGRAGVGVDNIDLDAATEAGVIVMNTPGGNTIATAELTFTHMLCGARPITQAAASMRENRWDRKLFVGSELRGKTLAVLGLGRIGAEVAKRAKAFDMEVIAYDPYLTDARARELEIGKVDLGDAFAQADFLTVHMPLTDETRGMVNADSFAKMKDGIRIFNCARGGIVDEDDLKTALESGKVAAAGLDVYGEEPLPEGHPLRGTKNLNLTPHLGASTKEAQENVGLEIAEAVIDVLQTGRIRHAINAPSVDPRDLEVLRPYLELARRLGSFVQQLGPTGVNSLRITYRGKIVDLDTMPLTRATQLGFLKGIAGNEVNDVNAASKMKCLGIEVTSTKSTSPADYSELIEVEAASDDKRASVAGILVGTARSPRIVQVDGESIEANPEGALLVVRNVDKPGILGKLGTILGKTQVNIGNMSLSRRDEGESDTALTIFELDEEPPIEVLDELQADADVHKAKVVRFS